jgi:hypothetical protein
MMEVWVSGAWRAYYGGEDALGRQVRSNGVNHLDDVVLHALLVRVRGLVVDGRCEDREARLQDRTNKFALHNQFALPARIRADQVERLDPHVLSQLGVGPELQQQTQQRSEVCSQQHARTFNKLFKEIEAVCNARVVGGGAATDDGKDRGDELLECHVGLAEVRSKSRHSSHSVDARGQLGLSKRAREEGEELREAWLQLLGERKRLKRLIV